MVRRRTDASYQIGERHDRAARERPGYESQASTDRNSNSGVDGLRWWCPCIRGLEADDCARDRTKESDFQLQEISVARNVKALIVVPAPPLNDLQWKSKNKAGNQTDSSAVWLAEPIPYPVANRR